MDRRDFIKKLIPISLEGYSKYNILPSLCIAQACLESDFGRKHMGSANNYFGFKASKSWKGKTITLPTKEWNGTKMVTVQGTFRAYDDLEESIRDYQRLIGTVTRYRNVCKATEYLTATTEVWKAGYATDPNYPKELQEIIEEFDLNSLDGERSERSMYMVTKNFSLSDNFKIGEFACKDAEKSVVVDRHLVQKLEELRKACGNRAIKINSGYRSPEYNKKIGGSPKSQHMLGSAADIVVKGMTPEEVAKKAIEVGFRGIGIYNTFTHVDVRYKVVNSIGRAYDYWDNRK